jgi:hypothetical protein
MAGVVHDLFWFLSRMMVFAAFGGVMAGCIVLTMNVLRAPADRRLDLFRIRLTEFSIWALVFIGLGFLIPDERKGSRAKTGPAQSFRTIRAAKDYLAGRIASEAARQGTPLSEVERGMLYFSETGWTLPDMQAVNAEFEHDYGEDGYEQRIAQLVASIEQQDKEQNPVEQERWFQALARLSHGDHYLSVLVGNAESLDESSGGLSRWLPVSNANCVASKRPQGDIFRLFVFALLCLVFMMILMYLWEGLGLHQAWREFFR